MTSPRMLLAVVIALCALAGLAHAEEPALRAAKRHFDRGEKLFALGKFDEALDQYQKAYDAKPIPDFLFNIGQCHRNLGDYQAAIFSFKKFLKLEPDAPNRERVERLIDELERKQSERDSQRIGIAPPSEPRSAEAPPGRPVYKKWWFWTGVAVVGVAGGVGIYSLTAGGPPDTTLGNMVFEK